MVKNSLNWGFSARRRRKKIGFLVISMKVPPPLVGGDLTTRGGTFNGIALITYLIFGFKKHYGLKISSLLI